MMRVNPPFRADHVGSLLRPQQLREAFGQVQRGEISADEFTAIQDEAIREVVRLQENVGLKSITDGEFRRASYWAHFVEAVDGMGVRPAVYNFHDDAGHEQDFLAPFVEGKVARTQSISGAAFDFLRSVTRETPKLTMPSPPTMHFWRGRQAIAADAYTDVEAFFEDLAQVYQAEIADLAARGATYIQIDEVPLAMLCDPDVRARITAQGDSPERYVESYVRLINNCLANRPENLAVSMHLCRGNFKGKWLAEGGYNYVAEQLFNEIEVDAYFLEYDTPRAGDFEPLSLVPPHKTVVLGLVSSKTAALESAEMLHGRLREASRFLPIEQLALSPQCGFASTVGGNPVTEADEVRKLELIVRVAREVWGE